MSRTDDHSRRELLKGGAASVLAASCWGWSHPAASAEDGAHVHGMVIAGEQAVYLSHLPLFSRPHDYQVILEATFAKAGSDPQADYFADRKRTGTQIYSLEPEPFVLPRLAAAEAPLRSFKADVYRGHFERLERRKLDAARIGQGVQVNVTRVIHFRKFDPAAAKLEQLEYLLFGKGSELLLAHPITRPPDFDQILAVKVLNHNFTDAELSQGTPIVVPGRPNSASRRIKGTAPVKARIKAAGGAPSKDLQLQPGFEFYFNDNDDLK
jgi:hypothetical protein